MLTLVAGYEGYFEMALFKQMLGHAPGSGVIVDPQGHKIVRRIIRCRKNSRDTIVAQKIQHLNVITNRRWKDHSTYPALQQSSKSVKIALIVLFLLDDEANGVLARFLDPSNQKLTQVGRAGNTVKDPDLDFLYPGKVSRSRIWGVVERRDCFINDIFRRLPNARVFVDYPGNCHRRHTRMFSNI